MKRAVTPGSIFGKDVTYAALMGRLAIVATVAVLAIFCLSGCGGTARANTTNTQSQPAATAVSQAQPPAGSQASNTPDDSMPDMAMPGMEMPDEPTPGASDANQGSAGTQPSSGQQADNSSSADSGNGAETVVQAALVEWSIQLSQSEVPAGKIRFVVSNQGKMPHNLTVEDDSGVIAKTPNFRPTEGTQTLEVDLKPGTYTLICSIPGHAKKGQVTTLVVK